MTGRVVIILVDALREDTSLNPKVMPFLQELNLKAVTMYFLALPLLWSYILNGFVVTWTLPHFSSIFLGFLSIVQGLFVPVIGLVLWRPERADLQVRPKPLVLALLTASTRTSLVISLQLMEKKNTDSASKIIVKMKNTSPRYQLSRNIVPIARVTVTAITTIFTANVRFLPSSRWLWDT